MAKLESYSGMYAGDDAQTRSDDAEVIDEPSPTHDHYTAAPDAGRHPPTTHRGIATPPHHSQRHDRARYHDISTPLAVAPEPRSGRTRSYRGLPHDGRSSRPPQGGATLGDIMAAIQFSRNETAASLADVARAQVPQTAAIDEVALRTDKVEKSKTSKPTRRATLEEAASRAPSSVPSVPSSTGSASGRSTDPHNIDRSILRLSAARLVARQAAEEAILPLIRAAKLSPKATRTTGPAMARSIVVRPDAPTTTEAESMVGALLDARRNEDGNWIKLSTTAPDGTDVVFYTDPTGRLLSDGRRGTCRKHDECPSVEVATARADGSSAMAAHLLVLLCGL